MNPFKLKARTRAYKEMFGSPEGKLILRDLCAAHNVWSTSFSPDSNVTAFQEGERNVVLRIFKIINIGDEELSQMITDAEKTGGRNV